MRPTLIAALAATALACDPPAKDSQAAQPAAPKVEVKAAAVSVVTLTPTPFAEKIEMSARVEAPRDATLSARGAGTVNTLAALGQMVAKDDVIARIDPGLQKAAIAAADAQIKMARAALSLARDNYERQKPLHEKGIISALEFRGLRGQLDQARAALEQAKAGRRQAAQQLETTEVVAPFAGRVEQRMVEPGEQVAPGTPVVRLVDISEVRVKAGVPERYATDVAIGAPVTVHFSAYGMPPVEGTVAFVGGTIDRASRTFPVEIPLPNPAGKLKPEMIAKVRLVRRSEKAALVLPQTAIQREGDASTVFVVDGERARKVAIETGASADGKVQITGGLAAGQVVIVRGQANLIDGDRVRVDDEAPAASAQRAEGAKP